MRLKQIIYPYKSTSAKRVLFKVKTSYKFQLLSRETSRLLGSPEQDIDKDNNGKNVPKLKFLK